MKKALTITRMTLLINIRKGTLWAIALVVILFSSAAFYMTKSDGKLANELEIRISYSYGVTYSILSLMIIALACFTVRSQIDAKNLHMVSSMPLERKWIFAGQAFALVIISFISELVLVGTVMANSWFFSSGFSEQERQTVFEKYSTTRREVRPFYIKKRQVALNFAKEQGIDVSELNGTEWYELYHNALRRETLIGEGVSKIWQFDLEDIPMEGETVKLLYKFQKGNKRSPIKGVFELTSPGYNIYFKKEIEAHQYAQGAVEIPINFIPDNGRFEVKFTNSGTNSVVVSRSGLIFSYSKGTLWENINKCFLSQTFHLSVSSLVGLCAGIALTFSVATFMVIMLYLIATGQPVFQLVMQDYEFYAETTFMDAVVNSIMAAAIWLTKGLQAPELVSNISSGLNIGWDYLLGSWFPAVAIYGVLASVLGAVMLTKKELDKVQT